MFIFVLAGHVLSKQARSVFCFECFSCISDNFPLRRYNDMPSFPKTSEITRCEGRETSLLQVQNYTIMEKIHWELVPDVM